MKICAIICEFNPFHNGHKYIIEMAKKLSNCDFLLCIMSGNFTQRGDFAVLDKSVRSRHAVLNGADAVIELPAAFSVAPAEIFAKGAIKILASIPEVTTLAFGCENPDADFLGAAKILNCESEKFKKILAEKLDGGESYIKSYAAAFAACGGNSALLSNPNNILGIEYAKDILKSNAGISVLPIKRIGQLYHETEIKSTYSSARAIRENIASAEVKNCVPSNVFGDLKDFSAQKQLFGELLRFTLLCTAPETLAKIYGCTEGLENSLLSRCNLPFEQLVKEVSGKRYTESRIKRITLANMLKLYANDCNKYLTAQLYIKPLAIKKELADLILPSLSKSSYRVLFKQKDINLLQDVAKKCLDSDIYADKIYNFMFGKPFNDFNYPQFI